MINLKMLTINR